MTFNEYKKYLNSDISFDENTMIYNISLNNYFYALSDNDKNIKYIYNIENELKRAVNLKPNFSIHQNKYYPTINKKLIDVLKELENYKDFLPYNIHFILSLSADSYYKIIYKPESKHLSPYDIYKPYSFYDSIKKFNTDIKELDKLLFVLQDIGFKIIEINSRAYNIYGFNLYRNIYIDNNNNTILISMMFNRAVFKNLRINKNEININKILKEIIPESILIKYKFKKINNV